MVDESSWVLVSDGASGSSRDAVVAIRALAYAGYNVAVTAAANGPNVPLSRFARRRIEMPDVSAPEFGDTLKGEMDDGGYSALIPASEMVSQVLASGWNHLLDKAELSRRAQEAGLPVIPFARYQTQDELLSDEQRPSFPIVVKPSVRTFKAFRAEDIETIKKRTPPDTSLVVQPYLSGPSDAISGVMWQGKLHSASQESWLRIWPRDCGLPSAAISEVPDATRTAGLERLMHGYEGLFSAQFLEGKIIDLNLRVHSTLPLSVVSGVNIPAIYTALMEGKAVQPRFSVAGHRFRWISGETKGVVADLSERAITPTALWEILRPRRGTVHPMVSVKDPLPMVARTIAKIGGSRA